MSTFAVSGNYAYAVDSDGNVYVVDITNPAYPTVDGSISTEAEYPSGIAVSGNYAYVADGNSGNVYVVNISDPANPTLAGSVDTGADYLDESTVSGSYLYVEKQHERLRH